MEKRKRHKWSPVQSNGDAVCKDCGARSTLVRNSRGRGRGTHREYWDGRKLRPYAPPCEAPKEHSGICATNNTGQPNPVCTCGAEPRSDYESAR